MEAIYSEEETMISNTYREFVESQGGLSDEASA